MSHYNSIEETASIFEAMKWAEEVLNASGRPDAPIDAKLLMKDLLGYTETDLLLNRRNALDEDKKQAYKALIEERQTGKPLQYITHTQEFMGLEFYVDERVLVPRQDTETLVETLLELNQKEHFKSAVDIGTGSGCISISLAHAIKDLKITAVDISKGALEVAEKNIASHQLSDRVTVLCSDLFENYPKEFGQVDLIVSNPPYISKEDTDELMVEVQGFEPRHALTDEKDGLSFYKAISAQAKHYLKPNGFIAYEIGYNQGEAVKMILTEAGFDEIKVIQDLAKKDRVVIARKTL